MFRFALYLCGCMLAARAAGACTAQEQQLACEVLRHSNIQAARTHVSGNSDNAYAYNNLQDMCAGREASRSRYACPECRSGAPGGTTCVRTPILQYLVELGRSYRIYITELAGGCHSCASRHYDGYAVDLRVNDISSAQRAAYVSTCNRRRGRGDDEGTHVHCGF